MKEVYSKYSERLTPTGTRKLERAIKDKWQERKDKQEKEFEKQAKEKAKKWKKRESSVRKVLKRKIKAPHIPLNRFLVGNRMRVKLGG